MSYTVEAKWTRNKNKDCLAIGGDLNINLLKRMRKHPRSLDFKYGVLSRGSSQNKHFHYIKTECKRLHNCNYQVTIKSEREEEDLLNIYIHLKELSQKGEIPMGYCD